MPPQGPTALTDTMARSCWRNGRLAIKRSGHQPDPSPEAVGVIGDTRFVVDREPELGHRLVGEELAVEEARGHRVTTGHSLEPVFVEPDVLTGLRGGDESLAREGGQVVGDTRTAVALEGAERRVGRVATNDSQEDAEEDALPVRSRPVTEEEALLRDVPSQAVAHRPLEEGDELCVTVEDLVDEVVPAKTGRISVERDVGVAGDAVIDGPRSQSSGTEVDDAIGGTEQPWIAVPAVTSISDRRLRPRLGDHRLEAGTVLALDGEAGLEATLLEVVDTERVAVALTCRLLGQPSDLVGVVDPPPMPGPQQPAPTPMVEASVVSEEASEVLAVGGVSATPIRSPSSSSVAGSRAGSTSPIWSDVPASGSGAGSGAVSLGVIIRPNPTSKYDIGARTTSEACLTAGRSSASTQHVARRSPRRLSHPAGEG